MKKIFLGMAILIAGNAIAQKDSAFTINGKLDKLKTGRIYLTVYKDAGPQRDSFNLANGNFSFKGTASKPYFAVITVKDHNRGDYFQFYAEAAKMTISGAGDSLKLLGINGSSLNNDDKALKTYLKPINDKYDAFYKAYDLADTKNPVVSDSLDEVESGLLKEKKKYVAEFVKKHPASLRSAMAIEENYGYYAEADEVGPVYNTLTPKIRASTNGMNVKKMLDAYKLVAVGQIAPDIQQLDTMGKAVSLSSLRGKYVMVDFWASWCGPCRKENPNIVKAYSAYKDKGFEIYGVSYDTDKGRAKWKKAIVDDGLGWVEVSDLKGWQNATSDQYYIKAIPANLILDKNGRIIAKNLFGKKLTDELATLLK